MWTWEGEAGYTGGGGKGGWGKDGGFFGAPLGQGLVEWRLVKLVRGWCLVFRLLPRFDSGAFPTVFT